jgi:hypothetical protein
VSRAVQSIDVLDLREKASALGCEKRGAEPTARKIDWLQIGALFAEYKGVLGKFFGAGWIAVQGFVARLARGLGLSGVGSSAASRTMRCSFSLAVLES